jgi:hypothetical protein
MFPDETACAAYLVARRWPNGGSLPLFDRATDVDNVVGDDTEPD